MSFDIIETIKKVGLGAIQEHALQVMFGVVKSVNPLEVKVGDTWVITEEFLVLDIPVEIGEEVVVIQYATGNKYLVLSTIEKVYNNPVWTGGVVNTVYPVTGQWKNLGTFKITHYCCEKYPHICNAGAPYKTATGTDPRFGVCAVDPKVIPLNSYIKINDVVYHAEDTGGAIKGNRVDLVTSTHQEALRLGTYRAQVYIKVGD